MATTPNIIDTSLITSTSGISYEAKYVESINILDQNDLKSIQEQYGSLDTTISYAPTGVFYGISGILYFYINTTKFPGLPSTSNLNGKWIKLSIDNGSNINVRWLKITLTPQSNQLIPQGTGNTLYTITSTWIDSSVPSDNFNYIIDLNNVFFLDSQVKYFNTTLSSFDLPYSPNIKNYIINYNGTSTSLLVNFSTSNYNETQQLFRNKKINISVINNSGTITLSYNMSISSIQDISFIPNGDKTITTGRSNTDSFSFLFLPNSSTGTDIYIIES